MGSSRRRLWALLFATPLFVVVVGAIYMMGMERLEGQERDLGESVMWAAETMTTTGYGNDSHWEHPLMVAFVIGVQFMGVGLTFLAFSLIVVPYFEQRFEGRLPRRAPPRMRDYVLVYRFGPAVSSLLDELDRADVPAVILEEEDAVARRLLERGRTVVFARLDDEDPDPKLITRARAIVANGSDQQNGALLLNARQLGFKGEIIALADRPLHRKPMMLAGATAVYTPLHILAAAMAALASERVNPRVAGIQRAKGHLHTAELRIQRESELAGKTLAQADIRAKTGATIIGQWRGGEFVPHPPAAARLEHRQILVAVGGKQSLERLGKLATPLAAKGPIVLLGGGEVGFKVHEMLHDAGEELVVVDQKPGDIVTLVGDALDQKILDKAGVRGARAVVLALGDDSTTLFAASVVRDFAREVPMIARVDRRENVERIHRAGADFALALGDVAAEILAQKMLGDEWVSLEARVKLARVRPAGLVGKGPGEGRVGELSGCSVLAVERGDDVFVEFDDGFRIAEDDLLHICGSEEGIARYYDAFEGSKID